MEKAKDVTRRDFLRTAAVAAAASALPGLGAPAILSAETAGSVVRYGFVGTGTEGCTLLKFLATVPEGRCVATCDIYPPNLKKGVETIGSNPQTYVDFHKMLEHKDMDAVLIATPLNLHAQMVLDALGAGKHVFVEKAMYFKEEESAQIRKSLDDHPKQLLQVGLQRRSSLLYQVAMEMIRKGALGKVMQIQTQWHSHTNWRRPVPDAKYERLLNWRMYKEYSGGPLAELASHQIDVANWAFDADPLSVIAAGGIDYWKDGRETFDNIEAIFEYPGGRRLVSTSLLWNSHEKFEEHIIGDQGTLDITLGKGMFYREPVAKVSTSGAKENWWAGATVSDQAALAGIPIFPEHGVMGDLGLVDREMRYAKRWLASMGIYNYEEPHDPWWSELHNFMVSVRDNKSVIVPYEIGLADAQAVIYGNRAIETGQKVFWPTAQPPKNPQIKKV
jgi:predicted dehydrogenase